MVCGKKGLTELSSKEHGAVFDVQSMKYMPSENLIWVLPPVRLKVVLDMGTSISCSSPGLRVLLGLCSLGSALINLF